MSKDQSNPEIIEALVRQGFTHNETAYGMSFLQDDRLYVRIIWPSREIHFGFRETFDRWSNSRDYEAPVPDKPGTIESIVATVRAMIRCSHTAGSRCTDWMHPDKANYLDKGCRKPLCDRCLHIKRHVRSRKKR